MTTCRLNFLIARISESDNGIILAVVNHYGDLILIPNLDDITSGKITMERAMLNIGIMRTSMDDFAHCITLHKNKIAVSLVSNCSYSSLSCWSMYFQAHGVTIISLTPKGYLTEDSSSPADADTCNNTYPCISGCHFSLCRANSSTPARSYLQLADTSLYFNWNLWNFEEDSSIPELELLSENLLGGPSNIVAATGKD